MKFKDKCLAVLAVLGLTEWTKAEDGKNTLTDSELAEVKKYFGEEFANDFAKALKEDFAGEEPANAQEPDKTVAMLRGVIGKQTAQLKDLEQQLAKLQQQGTAGHDELVKVQAQLAKCKETIAILSKAPEQEPQGAQTPAAGQQAADITNEHQLLGLEGARFCMDRPYNVRARAYMMQAMGYTMLAVPKAGSADFSTLKADLGEFYNIRWQDRLQSFLQTLPSITAIFPRESGYQDLETLINVFAGEFSQSDNTESDFDDVVKGSFDFEPETLKMYDVMFAHTFRDLKQLEKTWIGYLNREHSNPIKLSFVEFLLTETIKVLHNERELRTVNGVRKEPVKGKPSPFINAADGVYEYIRKRVDGFRDYLSGKTIYQIKPFALGSITPENIGDVIYAGTLQVPAVLRDSGKLCLYMPSLLCTWYAQWRVANYGLVQGYAGGETGSINHVVQLPNVQIKEVKNADNHRRLIWTIEGNIKTFEDAPGEMTQISMEQQDWKLKVWSNWKESTQARMVGRKVEKPEDTRYENQMIFVNEYDMAEDYYVECEKDSNPSVAQHTSVKTVANTSVFAITDIKDATTGQIIHIMCGSDNKGVTIANSGKFVLTAGSWTPKTGDRITLVARADGKFVEIARVAASTGALQFADKATTPSVKGGTVFVTAANSEPTALTGLADAEIGTTYTIYGAGSTNATTIANGGNFVLTAAMTLSEGKMIKLVAAEGGKFVEVSRA